MRYGTVRYHMRVLGHLAYSTAQHRTLQYSSAHLARALIQVELISSPLLSSVVSHFFHMFPSLAISFVPWLLFYLQ